MREKNHLYKKILDTAPFGTLFFAYGVCIDANLKALSILDCQRDDLVGLSLNEAKNSRPPAIIQLKQVIGKLESNQLEGLLWRSQDALDIDEVVVSLGAVENADNVISVRLYPLPALAKMVVEEFVTGDLDVISTAELDNKSETPELINSPEPINSPEQTIALSEQKPPSP